MKGKKTMKHSKVWEDIFDSRHVSCYRFKVRGGWRVVFWVNSLKSESSILISDPKHEWALEDKRKSSK